MKTISPKVKISSFTDESGQDTKGNMFVVCTICLLSEKTAEIEEKLLQLEKRSGKLRKWFHTGNKKRHLYVEQLLESGILKNLTIFCSTYRNKTEYTSLISAHIAKSILAFAKDNPYEAKIFIDKTDKSVIEAIKKEIKLFHIRYKKVRGLSDDANPFIRLADAVCGVIRDLDNKKPASSYQKLSRKIADV